MPVKSSPFLHRRTKGFNPIPALQEAGDWLKQNGLMPGYGQIFVKENGSGEAWYVGGDDDEDGFGDLVREKLTAVPGIDEVTYEAEGFPPRSDGWIQVYPKTRDWNKSFDEYLVKGKGEPCKPGETADSDGCIPAAENSSVKPSPFKENGGKADDNKEGGTAFYLPNVEEGLNFTRARANLSSEQQTAAKQLSVEIIETVIGGHDSFDAIGDWSDGSENSLMEELPKGTSYEDIVYSACWFGKLNNQKAVLAFTNDKDGSDRLYSTDVSEKDADALRGKLTELGIQFRTLIPIEKGFKVVVFDQGNKLESNLFTVEDYYNVRFKVQRGRGEFIGADTREGAQVEYDRRIAEYEKAGIHRHYRPARGDSVSGRGADAEKGIRQDLNGERHGENSSVDDKALRSGTGGDDGGLAGRGTSVLGKHVETKDLKPHKRGCLMAILPEKLRKQITDWVLENVPDFHLGPGGRELRPHCTILYGFTSSDPETVEQIKEIAQSRGPFQIQLLGASLFTSNCKKEKDGVPARVSPSTDPNHTLPYQTTPHPTSPHLTEPNLTPPNPIEAPGGSGGDDHCIENSDGDVLKVDIESPQLRKLNTDLMASFPVDNDYPDYRPHCTLAYILPEVNFAYRSIDAPFLNQLITIEEVEWSGADGNRETIKLSFLPLLATKSMEIDEEKRVPSGWESVEEDVHSIMDRRGVTWTVKPRLGERCTLLKNDSPWFHGSRRDCFECAENLMRKQDAKDMSWLDSGRGGTLVPPPKQGRTTKLARNVKAAPKPLKVEESFLARCERDQHGWCVAENEAGSEEQKRSSKHDPGIRVPEVATSKEFEREKDRLQESTENNRQAMAGQEPGSKEWWEHRKLRDQAEENHDRVVNTLAHAGGTVGYWDVHDSKIPESMLESVPKVMLAQLAKARQVLAEADEYSKPAKEEALAQAARKVVKVVNASLTRQLHPAKEKPYKGEMLHDAPNPLTTVNDPGFEQFSDQEGTWHQKVNAVKEAFITESEKVAARMGPDHPKAEEYQQVTEAMRLRWNKPNWWFHNRELPFKDLYEKVKNELIETEKRELAVGTRSKKKPAHPGLTKKRVVLGMDKFREASAAFASDQVAGRRKVAEIVQALTPVELNELAVQLDFRKRRWSEPGEGLDLLPKKEIEDLLLKRAALENLGNMPKSMPGWLAESLPNYAKRIDWSGMETKGVMDSVESAGRWLAQQWQKLESRYGRRAALAMAVAMVGTMPIPGNVAAVVGAAEAVRGIHGYVSGRQDAEKQEGRNLQGKPCEPGQTEKSGCKPADENKVVSPKVKPSPFAKHFDGWLTKDVSARSGQVSEWRNKPCPPGVSSERTGCIKKKPGQPQQEERAGQQEEQSQQPWKASEALEKVRRREEPLMIRGVEVDPFEIGEKPGVPGKFQAWVLGEGYVDIDLERVAESASQPPETARAVPPHGEELSDPDCAPECLHDPDPYEVDPETGVTVSSRVGVSGNSVPPPPKEIPRLPNLTEKERDAESRFAEAYLADPDGVAQRYLDMLKNKEIGDAPNVFNTDDAKALSLDYNPPGASDDVRNEARGTYNVAVHLVANVIAKRAFLKQLDSLPEDKKTVLVTSGGVASGKGWSISNVDQTKELAGKVGAVWDAAGEQNANENPWVLEECKKRNIVPIFAFVHADPVATWENEKRGVVERANKIGRMVDSRLFAESYTIGARNFKAFMDKYRDSGAEFFIIDNSKDEPQLINEVPEEALNYDVEEINGRASRALKHRAGSVHPYVLRGGLIGERLWGGPSEESWGE